VVLVRLDVGAVEAERDHLAPVVGSYPPANVLARVLIRPADRDEPLGHRVKAAVPSGHTELPEAPGDAGYEPPHQPEATTPPDATDGMLGRRSLTTRPDRGVNHVGIEGIGGFGGIGPRLRTRVGARLAGEPIEVGNDPVRGRRGSVHEITPVEEVRADPFAAVIGAERDGLREASPAVEPGDDPGDREDDRVSKQQPLYYPFPHEPADDSHIGPRSRTQLSTPTAHLVV